MPDEPGPPSLSGTYEIVGATTGSFGTIHQASAGSATFTDQPDGTAVLTIEGFAFTGGPTGVHSVAVTPEHSGLLRKLSGWAVDLRAPA